ncbi:MAG: ATP-binding cassette domain-containing protein, partial [Dermatophilaceae bacterium]|nr:ATP-binding cassette domain-containing protein [Dermatophilaceae bacterium]
MTIIETRDLVRDFKKTRALDRMTFSVEAGESVGYIGANGAGKSTTIKMLTGILKPTSGHVRTCGLEPMRERIGVARRVGVVFGQRSQLWWDLPLRDSFAILAAIHRLGEQEARTRTDTLVEQLEMGPQLATPV